MKTLGDIVRSASQGFGKIVAGTAAVAYLALNSTACTGMPTQQPVQEPTQTQQVSEYMPSLTPQVEITPSVEPTPEAEPTSLVQPTSQILTPTPQISLAETLTDMIDSAWLYQSYSYQDIMNVYETIRTQNPKDEWFTVNIKPGASASLLANIISNYLGEDTDTRIIATAMLVQAQQNTDSEAEALYNAGNISTGKVVLPLNPTGGESNPYWEIGEQTNPPVLSAQVGDTPTVEPTQYVEPTVGVVPTHTPTPQFSAEPTVQPTQEAPTPEPTREEITDFCSYYGSVTQEDLEDPDNQSKLVIPLADCNSLGSKISFVTYTTQSGGTATCANLNAPTGSPIIAPFDGVVKYSYAPFDPGDSKNDRFIISVQQGEDGPYFLIELYHGTQVPSLQLTQVQRGTVIGYVGDPLPDKERTRRYEAVGKMINITLLVRDPNYVYADISNPNYWFGGQGPVFLSP